MKILSVTRTRLLKSNIHANRSCSTFVSYLTCRVSDLSFLGLSLCTCYVCVFFLAYATDTRRGPAKDLWIYVRAKVYLNVSVLRAATTSENPDVKHRSRHRLRQLCVVRYISTHNTMAAVHNVTPSVRFKSPRRARMCLSFDFNLVRSALCTSGLWSVEVAEVNYTQIVYKLDFMFLSFDLRRYSCLCFDKNIIVTFSLSSSSYDLLRKLHHFTLHLYLILSVDSLLDAIQNHFNSSK